MPAVSLNPLNLPIFDALRSAAPALFAAAPGPTPRVPLQSTVFPNDGPPAYDGAIGS